MLNNCSVHDIYISRLFKNYAVSDVVEVRIGKWIDWLRLRPQVIVT
jgi:hypothetical protein